MIMTLIIVIMIVKMELVLLHAHDSFPLKLNEIIFDCLGWFLCHFPYSLFIMIFIIMPLLLYILYTKNI